MRTIICAFMSVLIGFWWISVCYVQEFDVSKGFAFCAGMVVASVIQFAGALVVFIVKDTR